MKKVMLNTIALLSGVGLSWGISAQELTARQEILPYLEKGSDIPLNVLSEMAKKEDNLEAHIDALLNYLLSIPFEQRQYIYPAIFDEPNVPKKIRTHPEIAIWEGKLPTDIAPENREFADQYLKDLNPKFFIYLSPQYAERRGNSDIPQSSEEGNSLFTPKSRPKVVGDVTDYPTLKEVLKQPEKLRKNPNLSSFTSDDIKRVDKGLEIFAAFLEKDISDNPEVKSKYDILSKLYTDSYKEKINPFQAKWERLQVMKAEKKLEEQLKKAGWKSGKDFAQKADAMAKAYRSARASLIVALEARKNRGIDPKTEIDTMILTGSKMYEALPADALLVQKNMQQVREAFIKSGFQYVLNTETIDALRK